MNSSKSHPIRNIIMGLSDMRQSTVFDRVTLLVAGLATIYIIHSYVSACSRDSSLPVAASQTRSEGPLVSKQREQKQLIGRLRAEIARLDEELRGLEAAKQAQRETIAENSPPRAAELDAIPWEYITDRAYYLTETSQMGMASHVYTVPFAERRFELKDLLAHSLTLASDLAGMKHMANSLRYQHGFVKFDPLRGSRSLLFFMASDGGGGGGKTLYSLLAERRFYAPAVVQVTALRKDELLLHLVMPLSGRLDKLASFLDTFGRAYAADGHLFLTVVYFGAVGLAEAQSLLKEKLAPLQARKAVFRVLRRPMPFSRGAGLQHGSASTESWPAALNQTGAVLFFIDVDMMFDVAALTHCRLLPQLGKRVYYPIVFSQYNPRIAYRHLDELPAATARTDHNYTSGLWRSFGFGMACLHHRDFVDSGGFDLDIKGWGAEDVLLYRKLLRQRKVVPMRAVDRSLFHVFHDKVCDRSLSADQMRMCQGSKGVSEASHEQMAYLLYEQKG